MLSSVTSQETAPRFPCLPQLCKKVNENRATSMKKVATEVTSEYPLVQGLGYSCDTWNTWIQSLALY